MENRKELFELLESLPKLRHETKHLKEKLDEQARKMRENIVTDSVRGSSPDFPYVERTIKIEGLEEDDGNLLRPLWINYMRQYDKSYQKQLDAEEAIEEVKDPEMRTILRMYYCDGLTQDEIAKKLGFERSTIAKKLAKFFE